MSSAPPPLDPTAAIELERIVREQGLEIVNDPQRLGAFLKDACGQLKLEIALIETAAETGVATSIAHAGSDSLPGARMEQLAIKLRDEQGLSLENAQWAVQAWAKALEVSPPAVKATGAEPEVTGGTGLPDTPPAPPLKRSQKVPLIAAAAVLGLIVLVLVIKQATGGGPDHSPSPTADPLEIQALHDDIPSSLISDCTAEYDMSSYPSGATAGYYCATSDVNAWFYRFPTRDSLDSYVADRTASLDSTDSARCAEGGFAGTWYLKRDPDTSLGDLLCHTSDGVPWVEWSIWSTDVYGKLQGNGTATSDTLPELAVIWSTTV